MHCYRHLEKQQMSLFKCMNNFPEYKITKTPVLILSTPRTGSTVLGMYIKSICENTDIVYWSEPDDTNDLSKFLKFFQYSKYFILKTHYINLHRYGTDVVDYLLNETYKIRIRRKDFVKQVASLHIAIVRNNGYHFRNKDQLNLVDTIPIDIAHIQKHIDYLKNANSLLDTAPVKFDLDLYYEDLPEINDSGFYITPKPSNYSELLDTIKKLVDIDGPA